jgi:hypothetical protein
MLYRLAQQHAASFIAHTEANSGSELPRFIKDEFVGVTNLGCSANNTLTGIGKYSLQWRTDTCGMTRSTERAAV